MGHLPHPGFSTADDPSDISGRGVGMDADRGLAFALVPSAGGVARLLDRPGLGT